MIIQRVSNKHKLGVWDHMHNIIESKKRRAFCKITQCVEVLLLGHIEAVYIATAMGVLQLIVMS